MYWVFANIIAVLAVPLLVLSPFLIKDAISPTRRTTITLQYIDSLYIYGVQVTIGIVGITSMSAFFFTPYPLALSFVTVTGIGIVAMLVSIASVWMTPTAEMKSVHPN